MYFYFSTINNLYISIASYQCTSFVSTEYTNDCGTVSVAEPVIAGKRMLFTFVPKNQTDVSEGNVELNYTYNNIPANT